MNMKNILFALLLLPQILFAQKHDYIWVSGDSNDPAITTHGGITIDFNQKPVTMVREKIKRPNRHNSLRIKVL